MDTHTKNKGIRMITMQSCIIKLLGMWLFCDAWFSVCCYIGKEKFLQNHIRYIRGIMAVAIMIWG